MPARPAEVHVQWAGFTLKPIPLPRPRVNVPFVTFMTQGLGRTPLKAFRNWRKSREAA